TTPQSSWAASIARLPAQSVRVSGQGDRWTRGLREVEGLEERGGVAITRSQRGEIPAPLDQLEDGRVVVLPVGDHAPACVGRDDERGHPRAEPEAIHGGWPHVIEPAATLVVGDHDGGAWPVATGHDRGHRLADPAVAGADRRVRGV